MTPEKRFFKRPEEKETLLVKQKEKARRLNHLRAHLSRFSPQWWVGIGEEIGLTVLFLTNFWLLSPYFGQPDEVNVFSAPLIPALTSLTDFFIPFSYGVRIWILVLMLLIPFSFYYFVREISGRKLNGFLASFLASLPIGVFLSLRIKLGLLAEDGGHMASLAFTPLVCLLLLRFLRSGNFWAGVFCALGATLVAFTSPIGFLVLLTFLVVVGFSEMLLGQGRIKAFRFLVVLALAAGFSALWYNPKFILLTLQSPQGQLIKATFSTLLPISLFLFPILGVFGFLLFENRPGLQPMFIAFFLTIAFGLFSVGAGVAHPFPSRFLPALGLSLAFLLGILVVWLFDFLRFSSWLEKLKVSPQRRKYLARLSLFLVFVFMAGVIMFFGRQLGSLEETKVLGSISEDKRVGIWEIREQTSRLESLVGYGISGITGIGVLLLRLRLR